MRYADQTLVLEYCKLGLAIATAKNPGTKHDVSEHETLRRGYQLIKARMEQLGPVKRDAFRKMLRDEVRAVREIMAKAKAAGEAFTLADIEVEMFDLETRQPVPGAPNVSLEPDGAGEEITTVGSTET